MHFKKFQRVKLMTKFNEPHGDLKQIVKKS